MACAASQPPAPIASFAGDAVGIEKPQAVLDSMNLDRLPDVAMSLSKTSLRARLSELAWFLLAFLALQPGFARADAPPGSNCETVASKRHRISGAIASAMVNSFFSNLGDRYTKIEFSFRGAYAYRVLTGLELGGGIGYWEGPYTGGFMPTLRVRPYLSLGDDVELGAHVAVGMFLRPSSAGTPRGWLGEAWSIGPDLTVWLSRGVGMEGAIDVSEGCVRGAPSSFGHTRRDCFVAVGRELGVVGRL